MHHCWYSGRFEQTLLKINLPHSRKLGPHILLVLFSESHLQCFPSNFPFGLTQCCWGTSIQDNQFPPQFTVWGVWRKEESAAQMLRWEKGRQQRRILSYFSKKSWGSCFSPHPFWCFMVKAKGRASHATKSGSTNRRKCYKRTERHSVSHQFNLGDFNQHWNLSGKEPTYWRR